MLNQEEHAKKLKFKHGTIVGSLWAPIAGVVFISGSNIFLLNRFLLHSAVYEREQLNLFEGIFKNTSLIQIKI